KRLRQMIEMLDVPSAARLGGLKVFRLKYASAKNLAEILQGLVTGQSVSSSSSSSSNSNSSSNSINNLISNNQNSGSSSGSSSVSTPSINLNSNSSNSQNAGITSFNQGGVSIIADPAQNALVVKAEPQLMREIDAAVQQLDTRRQQVMIEAAIIEVVGTDADQLGVQWALGDLNSGVGLINFSNLGSGLSKIAAGYLTGGAAGAAGALGDGASIGIGKYKEGSNGSRQLYGALIQALKENTKSNLLSTPSIVTMDNEEAYIVVGQNVPFVTGSVTTNSTGVNPYTTVERKDVGVTLKVIPHIGEGGSVRLEVEQEVSNVQNSKGQAADLVTSKRAIKTSVLADHGQTVVLGGLVSDNTTLGRQGLPILSDIPYLGRLFRSDNRSNEKRNLLVFIHPTIVGDSDDVRRISQQRYNQLYSLQLAMDKNGNFAKLPENVADIYSQQPAANSPYQKVPTATQAQKTVVVTTPVAVEQPQVQQKTVQLPVKETERSKNTVTTTTIRPASSQ
ncbi:type II secretion system protein GspD, partial [Acinetobacter sp. NRRL B-65365]